VDLICLETDIAVSKPTLEEAQRAMIDAMNSYFTTFSEAEIESGAHIRLAPRYYRFLWYLENTFVNGLMKSVGFLSNPIVMKGKYDPPTHHIQLA
jgi:hypothetical protein